LNIIYLLQNPIAYWLLDEIKAIQEKFSLFQIITLTETEDNKSIKSFVPLPKYTHLLVFGLLLIHPFRYFQIITEFRTQIGIRMIYRAFQISAHLRRFNVRDLHIHCHFATTTTSVALILHHLNGVSYSFTAHAYDIFSKSIPPDLLARKIRQAIFIRTISNYNKNFLLQMSCDVHKINVIQCGISANDFPMHNYTKRSKFSKIVSASNLVEKKGFHRIIQEWSVDPVNFPDLHWQIAGDGNYKKIINDFIQSRHLQDRISILPPIPHANLAGFISSGDVFFLPCIQTDDGNMDGIPVILMEAMAIGSIVISTPISGIPELIEHGRNGFLIREASFKALVATLSELTNMSISEINRIRYLARKTVLENFNIEKIAVKITDLFKRYIDH